MRDMSEKGRASSQVGEVNGKAKLSTDEVELLKLAAETLPVTQRDLARAFGVTQSAVSRILGGRSWVAGGRKRAA